MKEIKDFLKKFNEAFAKSDHSAILKMVTDDIVWEVYGDRRVNGREDFRDFLKNMQNEEKIKITIEDMIINDHEAAVTGKIKMKSANKTKEWAFCDVLKLQLTEEKILIRKIKSYVLESDF